MRDFMVAYAGNQLVGCVNKALATLHSNGTLAALQKKYLQVYLSVPTIQQALGDHGNASGRVHICRYKSS